MISDESIIIQRAQNGEPLAFAHLHDEYYPAVFRFFYYRTLHPQDAELLSSELFMKMVEKIGLFKPGDMIFLNWLYALARRLMMDDTLTNKGMPSLTLISKPQTSDTPGHPSRAACLKAALSLLSPDEREVLISRLIEKRSLHSVARALNRSLITARNLQHVALLNLTGALQEENCRDEA